MNVGSDRVRWGAALALVVVTCNISAACNIIYVDADAKGTSSGHSWTDACMALQDALMFATEGSEVRVAQGTYRPNISILGKRPSRGRSETFQLETGVTIQGGYAGFGQPDPNERDIEAYRTILSGDLYGNDDPVGPDAWAREQLSKDPTRQDNCYQVVTGSGMDTTAVLDGFTITAGLANKPDEDGEWVVEQHGAGLYCENGSPTIRRCTFLENSAHSGAAAYNQGDCQGKFEYCVFRHNDRAAVTNYMGASPTFIGCTFEENGPSGMSNSNGASPIVKLCTFRGHYSPYDFGAAISCGGNSNAILAGCLFENNFVGQRGGALFCSDGSDVVADNCIFRDNEATWYGGAVACELSNPIFRNCVFENNVAHDGGAIAVWNRYWHAAATSSLTVSNCLFTGNHASQNGGAISLDIWQQNAMTVMNCTFAGNTAQSARAVSIDSVRHEYTNQVQIGNSILWDGGDEVIKNDLSQLTISYSDIQGGFQGDDNIDADPLFADPNYGDYHLKSQGGRWEPASKSWLKDNATSPCINAGDPALSVGYEPAPNGGRINIGAYGGTAEASKSYSGDSACETIVIGDLNGDCVVDSKDFAIMASHWLEDNNP